jgi:hypothetical protein
MVRHTHIAHIAHIAQITLRLATLCALAAALPLHAGEAPVAAQPAQAGADIGCPNTTLKPQANGAQAKHGTKPAQPAGKAGAAATQEADNFEREIWRHQGVG